MRDWLCHRINMCALRLLGVPTRRMRVTQIRPCAGGGLIVLLDPQP